MANITGQKHDLTCSTGVNHVPPYTRKLMAWVIYLLTIAIKVRLAGLVVLLFVFLINCYLILFDQQSYIVLLEYFSPDGKISDIFSIFLKIQTPICILFLLWISIDQQSLDLLRKKSETGHQPWLHWRQRKTPYIAACYAWLLISYLPFLFFDYETIKMLAKEDSLYEYSSFLWLFLASISFFYLFSRRRRNLRKVGTKSSRNIFFLLLGLLFFFGAGEEISWGQRIFHFHTPEIMSSNLQHEFSLHNMPFFDTRVPGYKDNQHMNRGKKGIAQELTIYSLFNRFWFSFCVLIPILNLISFRVHKWMEKINFPVAPIWIGLFFMANSFIFYNVLQYFVPYPLSGPPREIMEAAYCFFFFILAVWFINVPQSVNLKLGIKFK